MRERKDEGKTERRKQRVRESRTLGKRKIGMAVNRPKPLSCLITEERKNRTEQNRTKLRESKNSALQGREEQNQKNKDQKERELSSRRECRPEPKSTKINDLELRNSRNRRSTEPKRSKTKSSAIQGVEEQNQREQRSTTKSPAIQGIEDRNKNISKIRNKEIEDPKEQELSHSNNRWQIIYKRDVQRAEEE